MDYHGNHYFIDVNISDLKQEGLMFLILLNRTTCYTKPCNFHIFSILNKWVGYFDPSV